ncbi:selenocysteine insertion sequence-binding protein 2 [Drosophila albomicans]|uniref:Selenocysteine insertion sequence-binding protein 2 n=1 Tax=Drosophila albomicans TaxID=7291 RepID=A0A6P8XD12_DROAB|nr:selenocysteine insertion sequence-binding protein 2 [Drosophila albomicans]
MSKSSGKLNIINRHTYEDFKSADGQRELKTLRSAKYKKKHKKEEQCSLFDFVIVPRKQQKSVNKNKKKRPNLIIARNSFTFQSKRKGKTRLHPKIRITRLKRIIRNFRKLKQQTINQDNVVDHLEEKFGGMFIEQPTKELDNSLSIQLDLLSHAKEPTETSLNNAMSATHQIHSRRFRSYCDNCTTKRLKELTTQLLNDLDRFQKRAYANNEIKARAHPRLVVGFREAQSRLRVNKVKLLLLAPDCEICPAAGGLDDTITELKSLCQQQRVPYCFSLMRRELAYALHKRAQISCVAILDYDGVNETFKQVVHEVNEARQQYKELTATAK